jgi:hypothetical protein
MSKRNVLTINSKDGQSLGGYNTNNLHYNLNERDLHEGKSITFKSMSFNNLIYNINSYNNTLNYVVAGVPTTVNIPIGNYSASTFVTAFNLAQAHIVISDNATTKKFSFNSVALTSILANSTLKRILGITVNTATGNAYTADSIYNFIYTYNVHIQCHNLCENDNVLGSDGKQYAIIATIPLNSGFAFVQYYEEQVKDDYSLLSGKSNVSYFGIQILDDEYRIVEMNNSPYVIQFVILSN